MRRGVKDDPLVVSRNTVFSDDWGARLAVHSTCSTAVHCDFSVSIDNARVTDVEGFSKNAAVPKEQPPARFSRAINLYKLLGQSSFLNLSSRRLFGSRFRDKVTSYLFPVPFCGL